MNYIVIISTDMYPDDFHSNYRMCHTLEEAQAYKSAIEADGDSSVYVEIYEAKQIA